MIESSNLFNKINDHIAVLHLKVKQKGDAGLHDDKIMCENIFKDLFNIIYDLSLQNLNTEGANHPAIDLGDTSKGICYQITFNNSAQKIKDTKHQYNKHKFNEVYSELRIFIFNDKPKKREKDECVFYTGDIIRAIKELSFEKLSKIACLLDRELIFKEERRAFEIQTLQKVIDFLSSKPLQNNDDMVEIPYPSDKLKMRFNEYTECIEEEYADLYPQYHQTLEQAKKFNIDDGNSRQIKSYLRKLSREYLHDENSNGRAALDKLINFVKSSIDIDCFEGALRFYILSELMDCDIFPLSKKEEKLIIGDAS